MTSALCWSHARRKFFELADVESNIRKGKSPKEISPIAFEAVKRIDALFEIERDITGKSPDERLEARQRLSAPAGRRSGTLASRRTRAALKACQGRQGDRLPAIAKPLVRIHLLPQGRPHLPDQQRRRKIRCAAWALGRKSWLFAGSERGGQRAAAMYSLIGTGKAERHRSASMACRCHRAHL